jgi:hypothetical protein
VLLLGLGCTVATAQVGADADIPWWVIASGGTLNASAGDTRMSATVGQPVIGVVSGGGFVLHQGFWYPRLQGSSSVTPDLAQAAAAGLRNYPNPFTTSTTISYMLPARSRVRLTLFDMQGVAVRTLVDDIQEGSQSVGWDGANGRGEEVSSGSYISVLDVTPVTSNRKFTVRQIMHRLK